MSLVKISVTELKELQQIYRVQWPLHIFTYNTIKNFTWRLEKFPEWENRVKFWSLNGAWKKNGTFVMTNGHMIFFNSLEASPYDELKTILKNLEYTKSMLFINTRDIFKSLVYNVVETFELAILFDKVCNCFFVPKENYKNLEIT